MTPDGVRGREGERASELQKPFFLYPHPHRKRGCWRGSSSFVFLHSRSRILTMLLKCRAEDLHVL